MLLSQDTWKFVNTFAPWLSAVGTISAVIVSLHLARRDKRIRLEVSAGIRLIVTPGIPESARNEYLAIHVVNIGHREAQITNVGWKAGIFKKRYAVQTNFMAGNSSSLPIRLRDGEEARYFVPLNEESDWLSGFGRDMLSRDWVQAYFLRIQVSTSVGVTVESRIEKGLRTKLIETMKQAGRG